MPYTRKRILRCPAKYARAGKPCRSFKLAVTAYKENHSHFEVGHHAASDYSEVTCIECGTRWRTKSKDVERLWESQRRVTLSAAAVRDKQDLLNSTRRSPGVGTGGPSILPSPCGPLDTPPLLPNYAGRLKPAKGGRDD